MSEPALSEDAPDGAHFGDAAAAGNLAQDEFGRRIAAELPFLRKTARRWVRERTNADDLVQDTAVQALANAHRWQPGSNMRGWLFTIMRNQFFAARGRADRFEPIAVGVDVAEVAVSSSPAEARLVIRDVELALRRLPRPQQTAVRLVAIEGKSYEEAATAMGMSVAAVRCHLARGRERLRSAVEGERGVLRLRLAFRRPEPAPATRRKIAAPAIEMAAE